jgi:hypothetical protein
MIVVALLVGGCAAPVQAPPPGAETRRYHDGNGWVTVQVLLDRLHVERGTSERVTAREAYLLRKPASSVAELEEVARQMRAAQPDIRQLSVFIDEPTTSGVRRERLTRQVLVRGRPSVDLAALVEARNARVVRQVDGRSDTLLTEATSRDLLAAFTLADALQSSGSVIAAIPLSE